ncbi:hypothetical protein HGRIS_000944 [Hohenbuehelia grisea]|uniref:Uncharacterized protein n=1 Tax=Hohenbuehelia grisea TaxID=104357 RepID=A0ABR3IQ89_9AGAR
MSSSPSGTGSTADVPAFIGFVETTVHALRLIYAARQGVIPRITRRLNDAERRTMIKSGAVFVFSVEESGIKRWTDGLLWSPSRIVGNFLVYREINERSSSRSAHKKTYHGDPSTRSPGGHSPTEMAGYKNNSDQGTFKPNGLIKKTITVTVEGSDLHLISYYTSEDVRSGRLKKPSSRPEIMALYMPPHIFRLTNFRNPPKVEVGPDGRPRLVCEAEDNDTVDVKTEETSYLGHGASPSWSSGSSQSQSSPVDNPYASGSALYPVSSTPDYSRHGSGDRWNTSLEGLRLPILGSGLPWTQPNLPGHAGHDLPVRRGSAMAGDTNSWNSLMSSSSRWEGGYSAPSNDSAFHDRARMRSGSGYQGMLPLARSGTGQDDPRSSSYSSYQSQHPGVNRAQHHHHQHSNTGQQRVSAWMSPGEPHAARESRTPHPATPFDPSSSSSQQQHFSPHGYHHAASHSYGSTQWSPTDALDLPSSQSPFAHHSTLHSYDTSFAAGSGTLPSPEEYPTKVEEFDDP